MCTEQYPWTLYAYSHRAFFRVLIIWKNARWLSSNCFAKEYTHLALLKSVTTSIEEEKRWAEIKILYISFYDCSLRPVIRVTSGAAVMTANRFIWRENVLRTVLRTFDADYVRSHNSDGKEEIKAQCNRKRWLLYPAPHSKRIMTHLESIILLKCGRW